MPSPNFNKRKQNKTTLKVLVPPREISKLQQLPFNVTEPFVTRRNLRFHHIAENRASAPLGKAIKLSMARVIITRAPECRNMGYINQLINPPGSY